MFTRAPLALRSRSARAPLALRSRSALAAKISLAVFICSVAAFAQLPTITVSSDQKPVNRNGTGCGTGGGGFFMSNISSIQDYVPLTNFKITDAGTGNIEIANKTNGQPADSIRVRGNSTAMGTYPKTPYRVKFKDKTSLLGMNPSRSWVLLAQYQDGSGIINPLAFKLSQMFEVAGTREFRHVRLKYKEGNKNEEDMGVYLLIPQIQGNGDGLLGFELDVKAKKGGWLAEFDLWTGSDEEDCKRYFTTSTYNINTKIREPELENLELGVDDPAFKQVKTDINNLMSKMNESNFPTNGYRDILDIHSWAKYVLIQKFMDNYDFIRDHMSGGGGFPIFGMPGQSTDTDQGSNYLHKIQDGEKIKAGPIWDFDGAVGAMNLSGCQGGSSRFDNYRCRTGKPNHKFYGRLWEDNTGFLPCYVKYWNDNKANILKLADNDGWIDSLANHIAPSISGNRADDLSNPNETSYKAHVEKLKGWWKNRVDYFDSQMPAVTAACPMEDVAIVDPPGKDPDDDPDPDPDPDPCAADPRAPGCNGGDPDPGSVEVVTVGNNAITIRSENGTVTWSISNGNQITLNARGDEGYSFTVWTAEGGPSGNNLPSTMQPNDPASETITFTVNNSRTIIANFEPTMLNIKHRAGLLPNGRNIMAVKNSVNLIVNRNANVRIVNLNGREVRKVNLTSGNHTISLNSLPRGVYLVNATIDGKRQTVRVPVR